MAVPATDARPQQAPKTEPKAAPKNEPKKPTDNTAAKQSPQAAKSAVNNAFGEVPKSGDAKQPDNTPKGGSAPKAPDSNPKLAVTAPKEAAGNIPGAPDKQAADPKAAAAADAKTAPGEPVKDAQGQPVKTAEGYDAVVDKNGNGVASDPATGSTAKNDMGHPYAVGKDGNYLKTEDGKDVVVNKYSGKLAAADSSDAAKANGGIATDKAGNPYIVQPDGKYATITGPGHILPTGESSGPETLYLVYDKASGNQPAAVSSKTGKPVGIPGGSAWAVDTASGKFIASPTLGPVGYNSDGKMIFPNMQDQKGNPFMALPDGQPAKTEDGKNIAYAKNAGGNPVAVDPNTQSPVKDAYGNLLALDAGGKYLKTPDGKEVVYNQDNEGKLAFVDPATGKIAADGSGNPYALTPNGEYAQTEDGNHVVWDKANGNNMIAIDNKTGQAITDGKGNPVALDDNGKYLKTPEGNTVVYDHAGNNFNLTATDQNGDPIAFNGMPAAVGKDGNYLKAADGNNIVYDNKGNPVAVDKDGKIVTDDQGKALAIDENGNYMAGVTYDKATGFKTTAEGKAVDKYGREIKDEQGKSAVYNSAGDPVFETGHKTPDGLPIYKDAKTGELQVSTPNGPVYKVAQETKDIKGAPLYDPVNDDPTRPPVTPNEDPTTTVKNLPQGSERGDPATIKNDLFDKYGNLSKENLYKALETYDTRDVYDALINAGQAGGWNQLNAPGNTVHPDAELAKQAISALIAWQNENGKYNPIRDGKVPSIVFYNGGKGEGPAKAGDNNAIYVNVDSDQADTSTIFNALNKNKMSEAFGTAYTAAANPSVDTVTEYLSNNWTGDKSDTANEVNAHADFKKLDDVVTELGHGDRNAGLEKLKKAYFSGDAAAIKEINFALEMMNLDEKKKAKK